MYSELLIIISPTACGFMDSEIWFSLLIDLLYLIFSLFNNIPYELPSNSSSIVTVTNLFFSFTWKLILLASWSKLNSSIWESVIISTSNLFSSHVTSSIIFGILS